MNIPCLRIAVAPLLVALMTLAGCGGGDSSPAGSAFATSATSRGPIGLADAAAAPAAPATAPTVRRLSAPGTVPDIVVQLRGGADAQTLAQAHGLTLVSRFGQRPIYRLRAPAGANLLALLDTLRTLPEVRFAEVNSETDVPEARHVSVWAIHVSVWAIGGDDGVWRGQWASQAMGLAEAHTVSTGAGIRVAVLDTGVDLAHPALAARWARTAGGRLLGRDFVDDDADPSDGGAAGLPANPGYGHGTHVSGLVALAAPGATLMPARVLDAAGRGNTWVLAEAVGWALDPDGNPATDDGAHVINLSLGGTAPTTLMKTVELLASCVFAEDDDHEEDFSDPGFDDDRARCAAGRSAVFVAAAGNGGSATEVLYPAAEARTTDTLLAVTAHTAEGRLAGFANHGLGVGLAAPGEGVVSTVPGGWGVWSGTSMAAPLAAGTAALVLATPGPGANGFNDPRLWKPKEVVQRLADRSGELCSTSGVRSLHAGAAVLQGTAPNAVCP